METRDRQQFPAAERVEQILQDRIAQGYYSAGAWLPAERILASEIGVSRPAVREALSRLVQDGLIVRKPGCRPRVNRPSPAPSARPGAILETSRRTIAAVLPQVPTYVWAHAILRGISQALQDFEAPYRLTVYDTHPSASQLRRTMSDEALERSVLERLGRDGADGMIIWQVADMANLPMVRRLQENGLRVVFIDRCPPDFDCDYVGADNRSGVRSAVDYLLDLGHRRIGYITHGTRVTTVIEREEGYREALLARGIALNPELIFATSKGGLIDLRTAVEHFRSLSPRPTAVVVVSDQHAFAFIRECQAAGWRVPEQLSVIGFDDIEHYSPNPAMLTTVHQPFEQIGQRAAQLLLRRLSTRTGSTVTFQHIVLPAPLIVRATCAPPRQADGGGTEYGL
jgi:DNA-binding LacI/PurR family transcriptional regulator